MMLMLLLHVSALAILLHLPLQWWAKLAIAAVMLASLWWSIYKHGTRRYAKAVVALKCEQGKWQILLRNGQWLAATLEKDSVITRFICALHFRVVRKTVKVALFKDSVSSASWRDLQVYYGTNSH